MKNQLLLLEDVDGIGRSGDLVNVRPGFARNYLLPQKKAIRAEGYTIRLQERLKEERAKRAVVDRKEAEELAKRLSEINLHIFVKIDAEGHLYGSVTAQDITTLLNEQHSVSVEKKNVVLPKPIKLLGSHKIRLKLKEGVMSEVSLEVVAEAKPTEA